MAVITRQELVKKNKAGNGLRNNDVGNNRENNAAIKKLAEILKNAAPKVAEDDEAYELSLNMYSNAFQTMATTAINSNNEGKIHGALRDLGGFEEGLSFTDPITKQTGYEMIVKTLPSIGSSKEEFDSLLRTANGVLELGLEKSILKPVDPQEQARQEAERRRQQELERQRREEERRRQEELERQRREELERQRQEEERRRQEELERQRREEERRRQEEERRRQEEERRLQEEQRKQQRVQDIKNQREAFLKEDYNGTDYWDPKVAPLKMEADYKEKQDAIEKATEVLNNENILDGEKEKYRRYINDQALNRRRQEKEEAALMAEDAAKHEEPIVQTKAQFISEDSGLDLSERFVKIWDENGIESAQDADGNVYKDRDAVLNAMQQPGARVLLYGKDKEFGLALENRGGELFATEKSPQAELGPDEVLPDRLPEKTVDGQQYILNWKAEDIAYALDADGKRYEGADQVKLALYGTDKKLMLYTQGEELPFMVEKRNNRFYATDERILDLKHLDDELFKATDAPVSAKDFLGKHWQTGEQSLQEKAVTEITGVDFFAKDKIAFALDARGNRYDSVDKIAAELDKADGRTLFIFENNDELPFAVQNKDGTFSKSDDRISTRNILPETHSFDPKKSLKPDDIGERPDAGNYFGLKGQKDDAGKVKKYYEKEIERINNIKKEGRPQPPKQPVKPRLGTWNTFVRGLKKVVTLGFGDETQAYKNYTNRKRRYEEDIKAFPEKQKAFEAKKKVYDDIEQNGDKMLADAQESLEKLNARLGNIRAEMNNASAGLDKGSMNIGRREVEDYRKRTEARLEGVQDLRKTGKITPDNIFAHTWLKEAECKGKPASDPEARKALCAYIAADSVQNEILTNRFKGMEKTAQTSDALDDRKVNPLNTGEAVNALMKDQDLKKILDQCGDEPIDPYWIKTRYVEKAAQRETEAWKELNVLTNAKADMERAFGQQELSEQALDEVLRYKKVQMDISNSGVRVRYKDGKEAMATTFAMKPTEEDKKPYREAFDALKAEGKGPMSLDDMTKALDNKKTQLDAQKEAGGPQL